MLNLDSLELSSALKSFVDPWYASLRDPSKAQTDTLDYLIERYAQTEYGKKFGVESVSSISDFQSRFPVSNYGSLKTVL